MKAYSIFVLPLFLFFVADGKQVFKAPTAQDIVNRIKKQVTCKWEDKTVDTFKAGNPDSKITGIAVCMFADITVLKKAVEQNCNFIITHEPVFYNHTDETEFLEQDPVFREKMKYIKEHRLVIWRFHDHWHATKPDGIYTGMIRKLGWEACSAEGSLTRFNLPPKRLEKLAQEISDRLGIESVRIIGDPGKEFTKIGFLAGAPGGRLQIKMLSENDVEVLIGGEVPEWETYLYVNDAVGLGMKKGAIFLGHIKSEEDGMAYCADWLKTFVREVPVQFIMENPNFIVK